MVEFPLVFGNVTLAVVGLLLLTFLLYFVLEAGIYGVKFILALDDENAPKLNLKNPVGMVLAKLLFDYGLKPVKVGDKWRIKNRTGAHYDKDGYFWYGSNADVWSTKFETEDEAANTRCVRESLGLTLIPSIKIIAAGLCVDVFIFLLSISFLPTIIAAVLVVTIFSVRFLAKRLYKLGKTVGGHTDDIAELKSATKGE